MSGVSLVIPLQDEETTVESLLHSVADQVLAPNEIVLVNAGSHDATVARAQKVPLHSPLRIVTVGRVHPGVARNAGVAVAKCEWIALTDGGVILESRWLAELVARTDAATDVIYGAFDPVCDTYFKQCAAIAYVPPKDSSGIRGPSVASCLVRRAAFTRTGGFPCFRAAEDLIFIHRLAEQGARAAFAPTAVVRWQIAGGARATFRRFALYSEHNLIAGWGRHWHAGTARLYAMLAVVMLGAGLLGWRGWSLLMPPLFLLSRAAKSAYVKHGSFDFETINPLRVLGVAGIIGMIDAATVWGAITWLRARVLSPNRDQC